MADRHPDDVAFDAWMDDWLRNHEFYELLAPEPVMGHLEILLRTTATVILLLYIFVHAFRRQVEHIDLQLRMRLLLIVVIVCLLTMVGR
jgi:heme A synthase